MYANVKAIPNIPLCSSKHRGHPSCAGHLNIRLNIASSIICTDHSVLSLCTYHGNKHRPVSPAMQVYWNSRLEAEHHRLVNTYFQPNDIVADIMCGIGPFAIPAAQKGCAVYANDLNPESTRYCALNAKLNRVAGNVHVFNIDGRAFVRLLCGTPGGPAEQVLRDRAVAAAAAAAAAATDAAAATASPAPAADAAQPSGTEPASIASSSGQAANQASGDGTAAAAAAAAGKAGKAGSGAAGAKGGSKGSSGSSKLGKGPPPLVAPVPDTFTPSLPGGMIFQHAVMNLPASAVEFLDAFSGAFHPPTWKGRLPLVHVYTFKTAAESEQGGLAIVIIS